MPNSSVRGPPRYRSYLLIMWEERSWDRRVASIWRFRLEDPHTGRKRGFASLEALVEALEKEMEGRDET